MSSIRFGFLQPMDPPDPTPTNVDRGGGLDRVAERALALSYDRPALARIRADQFLETRRHEDADNSLPDQPRPGESAPRTSCRIYPQLGCAITQLQIADVCD